MLMTDKTHRRCSICLKGYDYSQNGAYFITISTHRKQNLFGEIIDEEIKLNEFGRIVEDEWLRTAKMRSNIVLDEFVVMPNHVHGIVIIQRECRGTLQRAPTFEEFGQLTSDSIPSIIRGFKSAVTKRINELRQTLRIPVWQCNYYEHAIRDENDLDSIREYIRYNPLKWAEDEENPANCGE